MSHLVWAYVVECFSYNRRGKQRVMFILQRIAFRAIKKRNPVWLEQQRYRTGGSRLLTSDIVPQHGGFSALNPSPQA